MTNLDIPAFLRLTAEERKAAWVNVPLTVQGTQFALRAKQEDPETTKLRAALARDAVAKKAEGLANLGPPKGVPLEPGGR